MSKEKVIVEEVESKEMASLPNYDVSKGMSVADYVAQEIAKAEDKMNASRNREKINEIKIGVTCMEVNPREGSEKKDKSGKVIVDDNGVVERYPTKYYAKFAFMGGSIETEVNASQFAVLQPMQTYYCEGYMGEVKSYAKTSTQPIFRTFEQI